MEGFVPEPLLYRQIVTDGHENCEYSAAAEWLEILNSFISEENTKSCRDYSTEKCEGQAVASGFLQEPPDDTIFRSFEAPMEPENWETW